MNGLTDKQDPADATEVALDEADLAASRDPRRLSHEEVFAPLRTRKSNCATP